MFSDVKLELDNDPLISQYRYKYNLPLNDPRYLELTRDDLLKDFFTDLLLRKPDLTFNDLLRSKEEDDEWLKEEEQAILNSLSSPGNKPPIKDDFEEVVVQDSVNNDRDGI